MTPSEWKSEWHRLDHFRVGGEATREQVEREWFTQLKHHHVDAVSYGITQLIGSAKDTFLPGLGLLKEYIQARMSRYERTPGKCGECHGSGWVEQRPVKANGLIYEMLARCPVCGIPAPQVNPNPHTVPVTDVEWHEWRQGRYLRDVMPEGLQAKPWKPGAREAHKAEMREMFERLRLKLFANDEDAA